MIRLASLAVALLFLVPFNPDLAIVLGVPICIGLLLLLVAESLRGAK